MTRADEVDPDRQGHPTKISGGTISAMTLGTTPHPDVPIEQILERRWVACAHPERPPDEWVEYHVIPDCHGCTVAKEAARRSSP